MLDTSSAPTEVQTTADALANTVGVQVRRYGGLGDFSTVSIRGFSPGQVQIYLDGVPMSRAQNDVVNLSDLPLDAVDHIEVYRGATPLAFAQSGAGGIVNIVPRRAGETPLVAASASGGSFGTRKADVLASGASGAWEGLAFAHYLGSQGDFTFQTENTQNLDVPFRSRTVTREHNAFDLGDLTTRVGWRPDGPAALTLTTDTFAKDEDVPGVDRPQARQATLRTIRQLGHLDVAVAPPPDVPIDVRAGVFGVWQQQLNHDPLGEIAGARVDVDDRATAVGMQMLARGSLGAHQVPGVLLAGSHEGFAERDLVHDHNVPERTRFRATVAAEDEVLLFSDRVSIVPGVRWEGVHDDFPGDSFGITDPLQPTGVQERQFTSPRLGLRGEVLPGLTLLGNIGRYARVPNLVELFGRSGTLVGNPRLQPEIAFNRDVGFRAARPTVTGWLTDVGGEFSYFDNDVDQLVFLRPVGQVVVRPENLDSARVRGEEVAARGRLWDRVGLVANYTHQDARNTGDVNVKTHGKRIPGLPADEVYVRVELTWSPTTPLPLGRWCRDWWPGRLYYDLDAMSDDFLDVQNSARKHVGSRLYHGFGLEVSLPQRFRVGVELKNATDDSTRDAFRFPLPGRALFATVSWGFGGAASVVER